jgi:hypothetical protein
MGDPFIDVKVDCPWADKHRGRIVVADAWRVPVRLALA